MDTCFLVSDHVYLKYDDICLPFMSIIKNTEALIIQFLTSARSDQCE